MGAAIRNTYVSSAQQIANAADLGTTSIIKSWAYDAIVQGTWGATIDATKYDSYYFSNQAAAAINDEVNWQIFLGVGTYTFEYKVTEGTNVPILTWEIDGVSIGTKDGYNAGGVANTTHTITGIAITSGGNKTLSLSCPTKNGSASNWIMELCGDMVFKRTA